MKMNRWNSVWNEVRVAVGDNLGPEVWCQVRIHVGRRVRVYVGGNGRQMWCLMTDEVNE